MAGSNRERTNNDGKRVVLSLLRRRGEFSSHDRSGERAHDLQELRPHRFSRRHGVSLPVFEASRCEFLAAVAAAATPVDSQAGLVQAPQWLKPFQKKAFSAALKALLHPKAQCSAKTRLLYDPNSGAAVAWGMQCCKFLLPLLLRLRRCSVGWCRSSAYPGTRLPRTCSRACQT